MNAADETVLYDPALSTVLRALGVGPDALLGQGGEAWVVALDEKRVARISRAGMQAVDWINARNALLAELGRDLTGIPFAIPSVIEVRVVEGHLVSLERRLPGRPLIELLGEVGGGRRIALIRAYLDAAASIGDLRIERPWFGDLCVPEPIRSNSFRNYLTQRIERSLLAAGNAFSVVDPVALAAALPLPDRATLVHLDAFPGNMLAGERTISAVIDFGAASIIGDRRLDPLTAAIYLEQPITPTATDGDLRVAHQWLADHNLADLYPAVRRWIAAYWSFANDDVALYDWCRSVLLG